jgi:hypothetical protein
MGASSKRTFLAPPRTAPETGDDRLDTIGTPYFSGTPISGLGPPLKPNQVGPIFWNFFGCGVSVLRRLPRQRDSRSLLIRDSIFLAVAGGGVEKWSGAEHGAVRPVIGTSRREAARHGPERGPARRQRSTARDSAAQIGSDRCGFEAETDQRRNGTQRDRRGIARIGSARNSSEPSAGWLGAARRSGHHAGTACGAALHSRRGSVRVRRGSSKDQHWLGAAQSMRRSPDQRASMSHFVAWNLFKKSVLIEQ